ncbi:MAG TPA: hypothetical protein VE961_21790 [Pyrinomonadaceae bacterium]|nr:hypothetical protein [Pyrinomonadaceae bacterium]
MNYSFDKSRLPQGMSYPLKRSVLDETLERAGVSRIYVVYYWLRQGGDVVMRADYCGDATKGRFAAGQSSLTLYAVPSTERKQTETLLLAKGLPPLCAWLKRAEEAGNAWRGKDHHLAIRCTDGLLSFSEF